MDINPQERAKSTSEGLYLNDYIECLSLNVQGLKNLLAAFENLTPSNLLLNSEEGKDDELVKMQRVVNIIESMTKMGSEFNTLQTKMKNIMMENASSDRELKIVEIEDVKEEEKELKNISSLKPNQEEKDPANLTIKTELTINDNKVDENNNKESKEEMIVAKRRSSIGALVHNEIQGGGKQTLTEKVNNILIRAMKERDKDDVDGINIKKEILGWKSNSFSIFLMTTIIPFSFAAG